MNPVDSLGRRIVQRFADPLASWTRHDRGPSGWVNDAACVGRDPELFFGPDLSGRYGRQQAAAVEMAKSICRECPVIRPCLVHALNAHEVGVWGGTTEAEREELRRRRRA